MRKNHFGIIGRKRWRIYVSIIYISLFQSIDREIGDSIIVMVTIGLVYCTSFVYKVFFQNDITEIIQLVRYRDNLKIRFHACNCTILTVMFGEI